MKKLSIAAAALVALGAFSPAIADDGADQACGQDTHNAGTANEIATVDASGTYVYGTEDGGAGVTGSRGWIEAGEDGVRGSTAGGEVNGTASQDGVCLNEVKA